MKNNLKMKLSTGEGGLVRIASSRPHRVIGLKARHVIARSEGPGNRPPKNPSALQGRNTDLHNHSIIGRSHASSNKKMRRKCPFSKRNRPPPSANNFAHLWRALALSHPSAGLNAQKVCEKGPTHPAIALAEEVQASPAESRQNIFHSRADCHQLAPAPAIKPKIIKKGPKSN